MFSKNKYPTVSQPYKLTEGDKDLSSSMSIAEIVEISKGVMAGFVFSDYLDSNIKKYKEDRSLMVNFENCIEDINFDYTGIKARVLSIIGSRKTVFEKMRDAQELLDSPSLLNYAKVMAYRQSEYDARESVELEIEYSIMTRASLERLFRHLNAVSVSLVQHVEHIMFETKRDMGAESFDESYVMGVQELGNKAQMLFRNNNILVSIACLPERYYT